MRRTIIRALAAAVIAAGGVTSGAVMADPHGHGHGQGDGRSDEGDQRDDHDRGDHHDNGKHKGWDKHRDDDRRGDDQRGYAAYDYNRPDPRYGSYRPERYYRQDGYAPRTLGPADRIYRGGDGRYYCRRNDGTTGLVIGGLGGGVLGNLIAPGGSKTLGTVLGGVGGALLGRGIDRNGTTCR